MKYIIDASSMITAMNVRYPPQVFEKLWDEMSSAFSSGTILSSEVVLLELEKGSDDVTAWAKKHKGAFESTSTQETTEVGGILSRHPKLVDASLDREQADPYIIAKAKIGGNQFTVVSEENKNKPNKIPMVCTKENVRCIDFITMVRDLKWKF